MRRLERQLVRTALLVGAICLIATAVAAQNWTGSGSLALTVKSAKGKPLEGAIVTIAYREIGFGDGPAPRLTTNRGEVAFVGLAEGAWSLKIDHPDHLSYLATVTVRRGKKTHVLSEFLEATGAGRLTMRVKLEKGASSNIGEEIESQRVADVSPTTAEPARPSSESASDVSAEAQSKPVPAPVPEPVEQQRDIEPVADQAQLDEVPPPPPAPEPAIAVDEAQPGLEASAAALPQPASPPEQVPDPAPPHVRGIEPETKPGKVEEDVSEPVPVPDAPPVESPEPTDRQVAPDEPEEQMEIETSVAPAVDEPAAPPAAPEPAQESSVGTSESTVESLEEPTTMPAAPDSATATVTRAAEPMPEAEAIAESASPPRPPSEPAAEGAVETGQPMPAAKSVEASAVPTESTLLAVPAAAELVSYTDRTCRECRPGEWAVAANVNLEALSANACDVTSETLSAQLRSVASSARGRLRDYAGPLPTETVTIPSSLDRLFGDDSCRLLVLVLPAGSSFTGFRLQAQDTGEAVECAPERPCPISSARWLFTPALVEDDETAFVFSVFRNSAITVSRSATLTAYFLPPKGWANSLTRSD